MKGPIASFHAKHRYVKRMLILNMPSPIIIKSIRLLRISFPEVAQMVLKRPTISAPFSQFEGFQQRHYGQQKDRSHPPPRLPPEILVLQTWIVY